jgi:hypothetical protein
MLRVQKSRIFSFSAFGTFREVGFQVFILDCGFWKVLEHGMETVER